MNNLRKQFKKGQTAIGSGALPVGNGSPAHLLTEVRQSELLHLGRQAFDAPAQTVVPVEEDNFDDDVALIHSQGEVRLDVAHSRIGVSLKLGALLVGVIAGGFVDVDHLLSAGGLKVDSGAVLSRSVDDDDVGSVRSWVAAVGRLVEALVHQLVGEAEQLCCSRLQYVQSIDELLNELERRLLTLADSVDSTHDVAQLVEILALRPRCVLIEHLNRLKNDFIIFNTDLFQCFCDLE